MCLEKELGVIFVQFLGLDFLYNDEYLIIVRIFSTNLGRILWIMLKLSVFLFCGHIIKSKI